MIKWTSEYEHRRRRCMEEEEESNSKSVQKHGGGNTTDDGEAWEMLSECFREAQAALDRNRSLIQQVNDNHRSKLPENLAKNVALISEINANIAKVVALYSDLSVNFAGLVNRKRKSHQ